MQHTHHQPPRPQSCLSLSLYPVELSCLSMGILSISSAWQINKLPGFPVWEAGFLGSKGGWENAQGKHMAEDVLSASLGKGARQEGLPVPPTQPTKRHPQPRDGAQGLGRGCASPKSQGGLTAGPQPQGSRGRSSSPLHYAPSSPAQMTSVSSPDAAMRGEATRTSRSPQSEATII